MDSLRKSFKSNGSYKYTGRKLVANPEEKSILLEHEDDASKSMDRRDVVVDMDGATKKNRVWRGSSYEFWSDKDRGSSAVPKAENAGDGGSRDFDFSQQSPSADPPSKFIGQFLYKQKASGDISLDMDLEMEELCNDGLLSAVGESSRPQRLSSSRQQSLSPKELMVSFKEPSIEQLEISSESIRQRRKGSSDDDDDNESLGSRTIEGESHSEEVLRCTSNASFRKNSQLLQSKSKSRLIDPPSVEDEIKKSGRLLKSGQSKPLKSGKLKSEKLGRMDEDDEDPFVDEDLPDKFKEKIGVFTIFQWVSLVFIIAALVCSLTIPFLVRRTVWDLHLWKWVVMVLVLICGRLVSGWGIRIIVYLFERNFLLRKRVLYFVYGVRKAVQNCLWLGLVLIVWHYIFDKKVKKETKSQTLAYVTKILICLLVGASLWLVKTLLVKVLASSFHVSTYFDRIQESLFNQYVIQALSGPPLIEIERIHEEEDRIMAEVQNLQNAGAKMPADLKSAAFSSGRVIGSGGLQRSLKIAKNSKYSGMVTKPEDEDITIDHLHRLNQKNISAWNMKRLMNIVKNGVLSTLDERLHDQNQEDESSVEIRSEFEAKVAAKKIFHNVAKPGSKYIYLVDLMRFMPEDEATKAMGLFEGANENKRVSKTALKNWVVNSFRERRALSLTLNDTKTAVNKLHHMVNFVVAIIVVIVWLLILGIATTHILVLISSQLLLVVFVFGNTCKTVFEAIIFLFAMHPFDVGDRCEIDGVQMIVEEMNILTTVFLRFDNQKITYPNSVLATKPISNYYRSPDMGDSIDFYIHVATPVQKSAILKERIAEYIGNKKEHWYPSPMIVVRDIEDGNRLKISVWLQHRMNHQDMGERWVRRAALLEEMIKVLRELDIEYRLLPLDVNVRNMPSLSSTRLPSTWGTFT